MLVVAPSLQKTSYIRKILPLQRRIFLGLPLSSQTSLLALNPHPWHLPTDGRREVPQCICEKSLMHDKCSVFFLAKSMNLIVDTGKLFQLLKTSLEHVSIIWCSPEAYHAYNSYTNVQSLGTPLPPEKPILSHSFPMNPAFNIQWNWKSLHLTKTAIPHKASEELQDSVHHKKIYIVIICVQLKLSHPSLNSVNISSVGSGSND